MTPVRMKYLQSTYRGAQLRWPKPHICHIRSLQKQIQFPLGLFQLYIYLTLNAKKQSMQFTKRGSFISNAALLSVHVDKEGQQYSSGMRTSLLSWYSFFSPEITCETLSTQFLPSIFAMATCGACYTCIPSKQRALKFLGCNPICTEVENPFSSAIKSCFRERLSDPKSWVIGSFI